MVIMVVVLVDAFSGAVPGTNVAWYHALALGGNGRGDVVNTFKGRCHDAIFLESEPADRVRSYDFGLERDMSVAV